MKLKKLIQIITVLIILFGCTKPSENKQEEVVPQTTDEVIRFSREDFDLVLKGELPVHASRDEKRGDLADGGTTFYTGNGYDLIAKQTLAEKNGIKGYYYGPIITYKDKNLKEIADVKFYSSQEFKKFKNK